MIDIIIKARGKIVFTIGALAFIFALFLQVIPSHAQSPRSFDDTIIHSNILQTNPVTSTLQLDQHNIFFPLIPNYNDDYEKPLGSLADGWYSMVDDGHIVEHNLQRVYHPFQKHPNNPIMRADKPWEGTVIQLYGTVLPGFRMWYSTYNADGRYTRVAYAESDDGLNWHKPDLNGSGSNVIFGAANANLVSVIHTPHDVYKLFKLMIYQYGAFYGYWSGNGTQTYAYPENPLFSNGPGSDVAQFYWDSYNRQYAGTSKELAYVRGISRRVVRFIYSDNFINWTKHPDQFTPDIIDDQIYAGYHPHFYGLPTFLSGEQYLGLLWILKATDLAGLYGPTTVQLVSSHDGINWIRQTGNRPSILDVGPPGAWDDGQIYTATQPIKVGNELWLYYSGCNFMHGENNSEVICSIGLATAPYNRLVSFNGTGTILTDSLSQPGSQLHVNHNSSNGSISVELIRNGETIPGYQASNCNVMSGDNLDQIVTWVGQSGLPNTPFQIRFYLENSSLYAFSIQ